VSPRDKRFSTTIGIKPFSGHRYVFNGQVRIEWFAAGKRNTRTIGPNNPVNRDLADEVLTDALKEAKAVSLGQKHTEPLTLAGLLVKYREDAKVRRSRRSRKGLRDATLERYEEYERAVLAGLTDQKALPASDLRKGHVNAWISEQRKSPLAEGTIARRVDYLKQAYRWAVTEMEYLEVDPLAGVRRLSRESETAAYSPYEGKALFQALLGLPANRAWRFRTLAIIEAMYGARAHQVLNLEWTDVDFDRPLSLRLADGRNVILDGAVTYRAEVRGSKGQPDRTLPLLPLAREAFLEAYNHRRVGSPWVFWCHQNPSKPSPYGSMHHALRNLERATGVDHVPYRAFHGFRRALATAIVESLGVSQAAKWIGDTPAVIMRRYLKPTEEAKAEAAIYLVNAWNADPKPQPNSNSDGLLVSGYTGNAATVSTSVTGAAGIEPATYLNRPAIITDAASASPVEHEGKAG
jgi:integrase